MPGSTTPSSGGRLADLGAPQHVLELTDPGLLLALVVLGRVVAAVLLEVALVARSGDLLDDLLAPGAPEVVELGLQLVVGLLGQPDGALVGHVVAPASRCPGAVSCCWGCAPAHPERVGGSVLPSDRGRRGHGPDVAWTSAPGTGRTTRLASPARKRRSQRQRGRGWPVGRAAELLDRRGPPLGADHDLVGAVDRGEGELADRRVVLGERPQPAGRLDVVAEAYVEPRLRLVVARSPRRTRARR